MWYCSQLLEDGAGCVVITLLEKAAFTAAIMNMLISACCVKVGLGMRVSLVLVLAVK